MTVINGRRDHWWTVKDETVHESVFSALQYLDESQSHHRVSNLHHLRLYSNRIASGLGGRDYSIQSHGEKLRLNIVRSVIDAAVAQMATNRPRPMYLTEKGSYAIRTRAKRLGKFVMGQFYAIDQYHIAQDVFLDAAIFGTGFEKIYEMGGKICAERVFPDEIIIDDSEARYGFPRQLFQHKQINREVLARSALGKKFRDEIETAGLIREEHNYSDSASDPVSIVEAWHLPSSPTADDGRHIICVSNATLVDEEWKRESFPFAVFRWSKSPLGYLGTGIAEELTPIQVEINYLVGKVQEIANNITNSLWVRKGENIGRISNKVNSLNTYTNSLPQMLTLGVIPPELLQQIQYLEQKAYQLVGISQLAATSQKPAGLNSGVALNTYNDIGSQRFMHVGQRWEHFHVRQVAELILDCARDIEERGDGDLEVLAQGDKDVESIKFSEVSIERDKYVTKSWPVSLFPDTPSGKLDTIEKLAGVSDEVQKYLIPLLDFPDFDAVRSRINAPYELVEKQLELMLDHGKAQTPIPFMDLDLARHQGTLALLEATKDDQPDDKVELLRQWLDKLDGLQTPPALPAAPSAPPPDAAAAPQAAVPGPGLVPDPSAGGAPPIMQ